MTDKTIKNFILGEPLNPYIISEVGVNHEGSIKKAKEMIDASKLGGAHAVKFQSYKAEKIASKKSSPSYWDLDEESTTSQYELFKKYDAFNESDYIELYEYCNEVDIDFMSTPFDLEAVDFLEPIVPAFKIASADITNIPLIRKCASTKKPLIISTGASTLEEINFAYENANEHGAEFVVLLHCILNYPCPKENAHLSSITSLKKEFPNCLIGYSDHVKPDKTLSALELASSLGACILEKHFTFDKMLPGNDHYHSMDQNDLKALTRSLKNLRTLHSIGKKDLSKENSAIVNARRSIFTNTEIKKGEKLTEKNLIAKRPGNGISPIYWDDLIGKTALKDLQEDHLIDKYDFS